MSQAESHTKGLSELISNGSLSDSSILASMLRDSSTRLFKRGRVWESDSQTRTDARRGLVARMMRTSLPANLSDPIPVPSLFLQPKLDLLSPTQTALFDAEPTPSPSPSSYPKHRWTPFAHRDSAAFV